MLAYLDVLIRAHSVLAILFDKLFTILPSYVYINIYTSFLRYDNTTLTKLLETDLATCAETKKKRTRKTYTIRYDTIRHDTTRHDEASDDQ